MTITEAELSEMTFGIELEYDRISTRKAAETVAAAVGGTYRYDGSHLSNWVVTMPDGRKAQGAEDFLNMMKSYDYPTLSVHTMYMMQGKHIDYTWDAYGWNRDEILALGPDNIRPTGNAEWPWMIVLPEAHIIQ